MNESTDSNCSDSSTGVVSFENLCNFKERVCTKLCLPESPYCPLHTIGHNELPYVQCSVQSDSFQCKSVIHKKFRNRYCPYHSNTKSKGNIARQSESQNASNFDYKRSFSLDMSRQLTKSDEAKSLIEGVYKAKDRDAYFDRFSSDGESLDSDDSDDPLKHAAAFSTEEIVCQAIKRWKKYLDLCYDALGEVRYQMMNSYREKLHNTTDIKGPDSENPIVLSSPRVTEELKAYKKFLSVPKKETVHANNATLQKFMTNYKPVKANSYCQYPVIKTGSAKDRCNELVVPCSNYCLHHLVDREVGKNKLYNYKLPNQVLFKRCGGGPPGYKCDEIVVKWNADSRCNLHTSFEDAIHDPAVRQHNKSCLEKMDLQAGSSSSSNMPNATLDGYQADDNAGDDDRIKDVASIKKENVLL